MPTTTEFITDEYFTAILSTSVMDDGRSCHRQCAFKDVAYVTGGYSCDNKLLNSVEKIIIRYEDSDDEHNRYKIHNYSIPSMNNPRRNHGMCGIIYNNTRHLIVVGGEDGNRNDLQDVEIYSTENNIWSIIKSKLPIGTSWPGVLALDNNKIMIIGGWQNNERSNNILIIDIDQFYNNKENRNLTYDDQL